MSPLVHGWCPSLHRPMAARDGLIARVKPYARGLSAADLRQIGDAAQTHGSGEIELTGRAAFQIRGLSEASAPRFAAAMVEAGLASADPAAEARRNLQLDPRAGPAMRCWAAALEDWLESAQAPSALPSKFGFALCADAGLEADVQVEGGDLSAVRPAGSRLVARLEDPVSVVQALANAFLELAQEVSPVPRRMRGLMERVGAARVFAAAGLAAEPSPPLPPAQARVGADGGGFGLGVVLGAIDADHLRQVAALADLYADGRAALGPGRVLRLARVTDAATLRRAGARAGFIVARDDLRLRLHACVGAPGCARTEADVRADAKTLGDRAPLGGLHVSGCIKGCAHPSPAAVTLVAAGGGQLYDMVQDGAPADPPALRGLSLIQVADALRP